MNPKYKRIYCCTPVAFIADESTFFIRDTGLISRTIRSLGVESKVIMPLPYYEEDLRDEILRTEYRNLESAAWWRSLQLDAVILYSWAYPRYTRIAGAIHKAGIRLVLNADSNGNFGNIYGEQYNILKRIYLFARTKAVDFFRSKHMKYADVLTLATPAAEAISKRFFYGKWVVDRAFPMPCPVNPRMTYDGRQKENLILCSGRWDDEFQKRPELLTATLEALYKQGCDAETHIYGTITEQLTKWHSALPEHISSKIKLKGYLDNWLLVNEYRKAKIVLCPSRFEGVHVTSAEAVCCGCSVVVPLRPGALRVVIWYTTRNSGRVAADDTAEGFAKAISDELKAWEQGERNPNAIAAAWQPDLHVDKALNKMFC